MTVYWLVWDAAAHWIVDRLDAESALPAVRALRANGVRGAARPPAPNCQTPPSLATLFTGTWPSEHHVTGFRVPARHGPVEGSRSGFDPGACGVPFVWEAAGQAGWRTAAVHVPWVMDARSGPAADAAQSPDWLDGAVEAYSRRLGPPAAAELTGGSLDLGLGGHELRVNSTASQVSVASTTGEVQLTPGTGWTPLRLPGSAGTWLRVVDVPGRRLLLHTGAWAPRVAGGGALTAALRRAPVFAGAGLGSLYRDGVLGARLTDGGDGGAEGLFLSSLQCLSSSFTAAAQAALDHHRADLVIVYFPATDDAAHELIGWCDPASAACDPALGSAAWRQLRTCYGWADTLLGLLLRRAGADDTVVLSADHGIAGTAWTTYPNAALVAAGVAVADGGRLDARRCAVLYHPANNGLLCVNGEWREGGCVPAGQAGEVLRRAETVLRSVPHPLTGRPVVTGTSPAGTDSSALYLVFDTDCQPSAELPADGRVIGPSAKPGAHVTNGGDPRLHAVFAASGPGLPAGQDLGVIDSTWPAQLVLDQLSRAAADDRKARACTST